MPKGFVLSQCVGMPGGGLGWGRVGRGGGAGWGHDDVNSKSTHMHKLLAFTTFLIILRG